MTWIIHFYASDVDIEISDETVARELARKLERLGVDFYLEPKGRVQ